MTTPAADTHLKSAVAGMSGRFMGRLTSLRDSLAEGLEKYPADGGIWPGLGELHTEIHSIAGLAAFFGEAELGEEARRIDDTIRAHLAGAGGDVPRETLRSTLVTFHARVEETISTRT